MKCWPGCIAKVINCLEGNGAIVQCKDLCLGVSIDWGEPVWHVEPSTPINARAPDGSLNMAGTNDLLHVADRCLEPIYPKDEDEALWSGDPTLEEAKVLIKESIHGPTDGGR